MGPANVLEFEPIAKTKLSKWAYEYIATGVEDEFTMRANRTAFSRVWLRRRVMVDVSKTRHRHGSGGRAQSGGGQLQPGEACLGAPVGLGQAVRLQEA